MISGLSAFCLYVCAPHPSIRLALGVTQRLETHEHVQRGLADAVRRALVPEVETDAGEPARHVHDHLPLALLEQGKVRLRDERRADHVRFYRAQHAVGRKVERLVKAFVLRSIYA